jgi:hypothetical protein
MAMDKQITNREISRYLKQVKALIPIYGKRERSFLVELNTAIEDYIESSPSADIQQMHSHFGEPTKVASDYLSESDSDYLTRQIKRIRHIRIIVFILVVLIIAAFGVRMGLNYKNYSDARESYLSIKETIIDRTD